MIIRSENSNYDENHEVDFHLKNFVNRVLMRLNSILEYLVNNHPDFFLPYIRALGNRLSKIIKQEEEISSALSALLRNYRLKEKDGKMLLVDFFRLLRNKMIEVTKISLNLHKYYEGKSVRRMRITLIDKMRGSMIPQYLMAVTLKEIMPREEASEFFKKYVDSEYEITETRPSPLTMVEEILALYERESDRTHDFTTFKIQEGKMGMKITRCMGEEALRSFDKDFDREFAYIVECYPDFHRTKRMNEKFVLTRERSIMMGNSYCDFCWNDKRIVEKIEHPDKEFWEQI